MADGIAKPTLPRLRFHVGEANRGESKDSLVSGRWASKSPNEKDQPPLAGARLAWNTCVLIIASEAVRRSAVGCIGWLDAAADYYVTRVMEQCSK